jgi:hypothetical protein
MTAIVVFVIIRPEDWLVDSSRVDILMKHANISSQLFHVFRGQLSLQRIGSHPLFEMLDLLKAVIIGATKCAR